MSFERCRKCISYLCRNKRGSVLVELSIALPIFLLILTGMFTFSLLIYDQLTLTQAVGLGGQQLSQMRLTTSDPCADTYNTIVAAAPSLQKSDIGLTLTLNGNSVTSITCPNYLQYLTQGSPVTVKATYPCKYKIFGFVMSDCQLSSAVTEYEY